MKKMLLSWYSFSFIIDSNELAINVNSLLTANDPTYFNGKNNHLPLMRPLASNLTLDRKVQQETRARLILLN